MLLQSFVGRTARKKSVRNRSRRQAHHSLAAEQLEPRALLAVMSFVPPTGISPPDNLLVNGSFEDNQLAPKRTWDVFKPGQLTGWTIAAPEGVMAEIQRVGLAKWKGTNGSQWLELDGDETGPGVKWNKKEKGRAERGLYAIEQHVQVAANIPYQLSFDFAGRPGVGTGDNQMSYKVVDAGGQTILSGSLAAEFNSSKTPVWQTATTIFTPKTSGALLVQFGGKGFDNTLGMLLDNTVLVKAEVESVVDLDIDSNNDNRLLNPDRSNLEELLERTRGKKVVVNDNDTDSDGVPDYADGFGYRDGFAELPATKHGIAGKQFTPIILQIPEHVPVADMRVKFSYASSDPARMQSGFALPNDAGKIRLWTKNADVARNPHSVTDWLAAGDFIPHATEIQDLTKLGFSDTLRTQVFYVEGVRVSEGELVPISVVVTTADGEAPLGEQLVNVIVVSNTIVIGIDGTGSEAWLSKVVDGVRINERELQAPEEGTRWNSHVRNLVADSEASAMTIYRHGPAEFVMGSDSDDIFQDVLTTARDMIKDAGGGTTIALVGWSRGGMIAPGVAHALLTPEAGDLPRTVAFVGMYDPVDMSPQIPGAWASLHPDVKSVTIVGPNSGDSEKFNVDWPVGETPTATDPEFVRMALENRISVPGATTAVQRLFYNASHGALGGTPGFNSRHLDGGAYDYAIDVKNSIQADRDVRNAIRAAGLTFVPVRLDSWYGFAAKRPPVEHRG